MINEPLLLSYQLLPGNLLTATATTNIKPEASSAEYKLELIMKNKENQSILARETYTGTLPFSGQLKCEFFPYYAKNGCNFTFMANLTCSNPSTDNTQVINHNPIGAHLDIIYYGYGNLFQPVWSYRYSRLISSTQTKDGAFDKITLSLQPSENCLLLDKPHLKFFYKDIHGKKKEYKKSFIISRNDTKYQLEEALENASCENEKGVFDWSCFVTYTRKDDAEHKESAYIILSTDDGGTCL